jgi:hypothetical protein
MNYIDVNTPFCNVYSGNYYVNLASSIPTCIDVDALDYISRVEAEDLQPLEPLVKLAICSFITGCKTDGNWDAIKTGCIMAAARTLEGALVPLKNVTPPTNNNFVSADYDRKTGLKGDGSVKFLNANRNNNLQPQNDNHMAVYVTQGNTTGGIGRAYIGAGNQLSTTPNTWITRTTSSVVAFTNRNISFVTFPNSNPTGFVGMSRSSNTNFQYRVLGSTVIANLSSFVPISGGINVFRRTGSSASGSTGFHPSQARMSFYSIGEAIDMGALDMRLTTLMSDINTAII